MKDPSGTSTKKQRNVRLISRKELGRKVLLVDEKEHTTRKKFM